MACDVEPSVALPQHARLSDVLGCSSLSPTALAVDDVCGRTAYIAGSTITIVKDRQAHLVSTSRNSFSSVAFSACGRYLATGEVGNNPCIRVWEVCDDEGRFVGTQLAALPGHSSGISTVTFFGCARPFIVAVGDQHDKLLTVWDWRARQQVAASKLNNIVGPRPVHRTIQVTGIAVSPESSAFVTFGVKHAKMWTFEGERLHGRSFILNDKRNCTFSSGVFVTENRFLAIADNSFIVEVVSKKLQTTFSLGGLRIYDLGLLSDSKIVVGCENGRIAALSLNAVEGMSVDSLFPLPHYLGLNPEQATDDFVLDSSNHPSDSVYPDVRALAVHQASQSVSVLYADRSLFVWKRSTNGETVKMHSELAHVGAVNAVEMYPDGLSLLPAGTFVTGGADGTVRFWNLTKPAMDQIIQTRNVYSAPLKKIIYTSQDAQLLSEPLDENGLVPPVRLDATDAIKSLRFSTDGRHLVIGRQNGNILIYDIVTMTLSLFLDAHESDVFALEFNDPGRTGVSLMASGSRDQLVHLYNAAHNYDYLQTLQDHEGAVVAIKFATANDNVLRMYTLGTDKLIITWTFSGDIFAPFVRASVIKQGVAMADMAVLPELNGFAVACADRQIRVYSLSGRHSGGFSATGSDRAVVGPANAAAVGKIAFDPSGTLCAIICDRMIYVLEVRTQRVLMTLPGTGDVPTQLAFSTDLRSILICSANGCVYSWRLSEKLVMRLQAAAKDLYERIESRRTPSPDSVLGSGSDCLSEELPLSAAEPLDSLKPSFGSVDSIHLLGHIDPARTFFVPTTSTPGLEVERKIEAVVRHGNNSSLGQSGSNFDLTSEKDPEDMMYERTPKQYSSSKSMQNLRLQPDGSSRQPRTPRRQWAGESQADFNCNDLLAGLIEGSQKPMPNNENTYASPAQLKSPPSQNGSYAITPLSLQQRIGQPRLPSVTRSPFNRTDTQRVSLSKSFLNKGLSVAPSPGTTVWQPPSHSSTPSSRRTMSTLTGSMTPTGAVASAISRRQSAVAPRTSAASEKIRRVKTFGRIREKETASNADDYSASQLHLRSRSQSPNHLLQSGIFASRRRDSDMSTPGASPLLTASRVLTSSRSNLMQPEGVRKSNQALDKLADMKSKLRQSTENIMGDEESLSRGHGLGASSVLRSKSIGNLRHSLDPYNSCDIEHARPKLGALAQGRTLARSVGNVSASEDGQQHKASASNLAQRISMLKKASRPDQYDEEPGSLQDRLVRRGAVQKRVERYHPRNRSAGLSGRAAAGTSEESDSASNASDASPLGNSLSNGLPGRRYFGAVGNRSVSSVEGRGLVASSRRLFDSRHGSSVSQQAPVRRSNYLASKLAVEDDVAPDLPSDESARASSLGAPDLTSLPERDQQMVRHVEETLKHARDAVTQALHAEMLLRDSSIGDDVRTSLSHKWLESLQGIGQMVSNALERKGVRSPQSSESSFTLPNGNSFNPTFSSPFDAKAFFKQHENELRAVLKSPGN